MADFGRRRLKLSLAKSYGSTKTYLMWRDGGRQTDKLSASLPVDATMCIFRRDQFPAEIKNRHRY